MFTGIVEEIGIVKAISSNKITIECSKILDDIKLGDSIAVNGVCLTVTEFDANYFNADISPETFKVTALKELSNGSTINLERALKLSDRLGGHIVSGHIDTIGKIHQISKNKDFYDLKIEFNNEYQKYVVKKGSITINGISLTIADIKNNIVTIAVIPHTYENTMLKDLKNNDNVNIEFDILAKYVEKNLLSKDNNNITMDLLERNGFV